MNNVQLAFRNLFGKKQNNIIKIVSLGVGLAIGLILITKVNFELNFDDFYPDSDRIYMIQSSSGDENEALNIYWRTSGGVAIGMKNEIPEMEAATRFTNLGSEDEVFFYQDKKRLTARFIIADSCLFDVLSRPMIAGNPKDILSRPMYALVSKSIADKMGGDVVNRQIQLDNYPGKLITIGGVFEDIPENSHYRYDIAVSLSSARNFIGGNPIGWGDNDRYLGYIKLRENVDPASLKDAMYKTLEKNQDLEVLKAIGFDWSYYLFPLTQLHNYSPNVKRSTNLLMVIAFTLIMTVVMNYLLIVISTLVERAKGIAIYKCYGATKGNVTKMILIETLLHLVLSLLLAALLIVIFKDTIEEILSASLMALFTLRSAFLILVICLFVFFIAALGPSYILSSTSVLSIFRIVNKSRKGWKKKLLFLQFVAATFLITLLIIVGKQYSMMINDDPHYNYENLIYTNIAGTDVSQKEAAINELKRLPQISMVATSSVLPYIVSSGNRISIPENKEDEYLVMDLYYTDENYFELMGISIIDGKGMNGKNASTDIWISKALADKMEMIIGWNDGVVGKSVYMTEHGSGQQIAGVYADFKLGTIVRSDDRPSVLHFSNVPQNNILIKLNKLNGENIKVVYDALKRSLPDKDIVLIPYKDSMVKEYNSERLFRNAIMIGGIITLFITLIGLIGYINNEIVRRSSEIALRKINGATMKNILAIFIKDTLTVSLLAIIFGCISAYWVAGEWMANFALKIELTPWLFIGCSLLMLAIIQLVVIANCIKISNQNPVDALKTE